MVAADTDVLALALEEQGLFTTVDAAAAAVGVGVRLVGGMGLG